MRKLSHILRSFITLSLVLAFAISLSSCLSSEDKNLRRQALKALSDSNTTYALPSGVTVPRQVAVSQDGLELTILGMSEEYGETSLVAALVNSSGRTVSVQVEDVTVNGWQFQSYSDMYNIPSHGAQIGHISLDNTLLSAVGISDWGTVSFDLNIYDSDRYEDILTVPVSLETSVSDEVIISDEIIGTTLYDRNDTAFTVISAVTDSWGDQTITFGLFNNSARSIDFSVYGATLNGETVSMYLSESISPDTRAVTDVSLYDDEYNSVSVSPGDTLSFELQLYTDGYTLLDEQTVSYCPERDS